MRFIDEQGNTIERTDGLCTLLDEINKHLRTLTKEERIAWFRQTTYAEPLNFTKEIDGTLYVVRAFFKDEANENISEKIERIILKKQ